MTNEEMARAINAGNKDYMNTLWLAVEKFVQSQACKFYHGHLLRCKQTGIDVDDLTQSGYFALIKACDAYTGDLAEKYMFLTVFGQYLKSEFCSLAKMRSTGWQNNTVIQAISLDNKLNSDSEQTFCETMPDRKAEEAFDKVEAREYQEQIKKALDKVWPTLTPSQSRVIYGLYYLNHTYTELAEQSGVTRPTINNARLGAMLKFRRNPELLALSRI